MGLFQNFISELLTFIIANQHWAAPIVFALAFFKSLAFCSFVVPAALILA